MADVNVAQRDARLVITLNRPERHNSLTPSFMRDILAALEQATSDDIRLVLLQAKGRSFSTGGDIMGFLDHAANSAQLQNYAADLVGTLNQTLLALLALQKPVITVAQGLVTGGAAGLLFASDYCLLAEDAFLQPYYGEVGFAPDGGWTALLPEHIGRSRTLEIIMQNRRIVAPEAKALGIVDMISPCEGLLAHAEKLCDKIISQDKHTIAASKSLLWSNSRRSQLAHLLEEEKQAFLHAIDRPECTRKMAAFVGGHVAASSNTDHQTPGEKE